MSKMDAIKMLKDEIASKVDADTLKKLEKATSKKEALSILEGISVSLSDDMLDAVSGGAGDDSFGGVNAGWCSSNACDDFYA